MSRSRDGHRATALGMGDRTKLFHTSPWLDLDLTGFGVIARHKTFLPGLGYGKNTNDDGQLRRKPPTVVLRAIRLIADGRWIVGSRCPF